jgi:hypothetical protein
MLRSGAAGVTIAVTSLAVEFTELTAPSLDTGAVFVTVEGAFAATFTVSAMAG